MATMKVNGTPTRSIWRVEAQPVVEIIDQTALPHAYRILRLASLEDAAHAIRSMQVRGAPLIGATAAYGVALALERHADDGALASAIATLGATRPTAVNLHWALARMQQHLAPLPVAARCAAAWQEAAAINDEDVAQNRAIGEHGLELLKPLTEKHGRLDIMTHCNAGWLATVDHGTALSPVYAAFAAGIASMSGFRNAAAQPGPAHGMGTEAAGVPHTVIADNAAGLLLARGEVDAVIVGADRIAANGDVANKVGTYLKALAAREAGVPFFVAAPRSTLDFDCASGGHIPIEEREGDELRVLHGRNGDGQPASVRQLPENEAVANPAFDVTPARFVSAIITERGSCAPNALHSLYPEIAK
jgi:methylthioribose-1-phosphate isomerase